MIWELWFFLYKLIWIITTFLFLISIQFWVITLLWCFCSNESKINLNSFFMTAVRTFKYSFCSSNLRFACWCNNSGNTDKLSYKIALKISNHWRYFIRLYLDLKPWWCLHVFIHWVINIISVNFLYSFLKNFDISVRNTSEFFS